MARSIEEIENEIEALVEELKKIDTQDNIREYLFCLTNPDGWEEEEQ